MGNLARVCSILRARPWSCDVEEDLVLHWIDARVLPAWRIDADRYSVAFVDLWAFLENWSLLGSARALAGRAVLADGAGPC